MKSYRFNREEFFNAVLGRLEWSSQEPNYNYGDFFEFGVWKGERSLLFWNCLKEIFGTSLPSYWHMYLFDSFQGLPESNRVEDLNPQFPAGEYNVGSAKYVEEFLLTEGVPQDRFTIIEGLFDETLTAELAHALPANNAGLIYMDCDLYSSTETALNWVKPFIRNRSILYLDDRWSYSGHPKKGEYGALIDFCERNEDVGFNEYPILGQDSRRVYLAWRDNLDFIR